MYLIGESRYHSGKIVAYMKLIACGVRLYAEADLSIGYRDIMYSLHDQIIKQAIDKDIDMCYLPFLDKEDEDVGWDDEYE